MKIGLIKVVDRIFGFPLCLLLSIINLIWNKKMLAKEKIRRILIIQLWGIGETILTIPSIKFLKKEYRQAQIEILCTARNKDVYLGYRFIKKLNVLNLNIFNIILFIFRNYKRYDVVIDMEEYLNISAIIAFFVGNYNVGFSHKARSLLYDTKVEYNDKQHVSKTFFDLVRSLGVKGSIKNLEKLNYTRKDKNRVDEILKTEGINRRSFIVGIASGVAESAKSRIWPKENFAELIKRIYKKKKKSVFLLIGTKSDLPLNESIIKLVDDKKIKIVNLAGKFSLRQTFYLISRFNILISNDSGPMHIGAAMGVKTIGLFGPNTPVRFGPFSSKGISIYKKIYCSPCINVHKGEVPGCLHKKTSKDYKKCMRSISVDDVMHYV